MSVDNSFDFPFIKGITFGYMAKKGSLAPYETFKSLDLVAESLNINTVVLPVPACRQNAQSTAAEYKGPNAVAEFEIENMIDYAHKKGLRVILNPMLNLPGSTPRAGIESPCEWFQSYGEFILQMARIAQRTGCSIFAVGCGLAQSETREEEWRRLIAAVREVYHGFITYISDKNQENHVSWWDAVDLISSAGCFSGGDFSAKTQTIKEVVTKHKKPFILIEKEHSVKESAPNFSKKTEKKSPLDLREKAEYFEKLLCKSKDFSWVCGYCLSD